jgi:putative transcriptional regulator
MKSKKLKNDTFFEELKEGLQEILDYKKGKIKLSSESIVLPEPPSKYKAKEIRNIRERKNYSQGIFAKILNVSPKTIQSWESGIRNPSQSALRLIEIIDKGIYDPQISKKSR